MEAMKEEQRSRLKVESAIGKFLPYKESERNPELAEICGQYKVTEKVFDECLKIEMKDKDNYSLSLLK